MSNVIGRVLCLEALRTKGFPATHGKDGTICTSIWQPLIVALQNISNWEGVVDATYLTIQLREFSRKR